jgi:hypothetical protein
MRETGTAIASGDKDTAGHWATFLALFQNIGTCEDENVKYDEVPNTVNIEYGEKHPHSYDATLDVKFIQNAKADFDAIEDMKDENCDLLITDDINHIYFYFHNKRFKVERHLVSGGIPYFNIQLHQVAGQVSGAYAAVYEYGTIPV